MGEDDMTSIEKIRAQVEEVRREHHAVHESLGAYDFCNKDEANWPCPTLRLAEKVLKLAQFVDNIRTGKYLSQRDDVEVAERVLAECAEEE